MKNYEYDYAMIDEMIIIMRNDEAFYWAVDTVKSVYGNKPLTREIIAHAASYAIEVFTDVWQEYENADYLLMPEYFKACYEAIPDLWITLN